MLSIKSVVVCRASDPKTRSRCVGYVPTPPILLRPLKHPQTLVPYPSLLQTTTSDVIRGDEVPLRVVISLNGVVHLYIFMSIMHSGISPYGRELGQLGYKRGRRGLSGVREGSEGTNRNSTSPPIVSTDVVKVYVLSKDRI